MAHDPVSEYEFAKEMDEEQYGAEDDEAISEEDNILKRANIDSQSNTLPERKEIFGEEEDDQQSDEEEEESSAQGSGDS